MDSILKRDGAQRSARLVDFFAVDYPQKCASVFGVGFSHYSVLVLRGEATRAGPESGNLCVGSGPVSSVELAVADLDVALSLSAPMIACSRLP